MLLQTVRQLWRPADATWPLLWVAAFVVVAVGAVAATWLAELSQRERSLASEITALRSALSASAASAQAESMPADFSTRLPYLIDVPAVLLTIQRSCKEADVIFGGLQVQQLSTTPEQLPRVGVTLSLRGSYSKLKQVLADVLGRFPGATLSRMSLRRGTAPADLEATVALALWGRAAGSPAASTASGPEPGLR